MLLSSHSRKIKSDLEKVVYVLSPSLECSEKNQDSLSCGGSSMDRCMVGFMTENLKPVLSFKNVSVSYKNHCALENISIDFFEGSLTAILGPNGGGKSTLLKVILGLVPLQNGEIQHFHLKPKDIAYLPQQTEIDRTFPLTVYDVVALGLSQTKGFFQEIGQKTDTTIQKALEKVGLKEMANRSLHMLSGGQFQRVLFARAMLQDAKIILLDEPFAAVDRYTMEDLIKIVKSWTAERRTVIIVSHDLEFVQSYFPQSLLLARNVIAYGSTKEVLTLENLQQAKRNSREWEDANLEDDKTMQFFKNV